eukprot:scaffold165133_cov16-Prasinocladus_malaysianus.AAC.1
MACTWQAIQTSLLIEASGSIIHSAANCFACHSMQVQDRSNPSWATWWERESGSYQPRAIINRVDAALENDLNALITLKAHSLRHSDLADEPNLQFKLYNPITTNLTSQLTPTKLCKATTMRHVCFKIQKLHSNKDDFAMASINAFVSCSSRMKDPFRAA